MSRRHRLKRIAPKQRREIIGADLGTKEGAQHGDWRTLELPVLGRRRQRQAIHERLFSAGRISPAEWQAVEDFARDHALASGARDSERGWERVDGGRNFEPTIMVVNALARLRLAYGRLGVARSRILELVACEGSSAGEIARMLLRSDSGGARERIDELVVDAAQVLAGTERRNSDGTGR